MWIFCVPAKEGGTEDKPTFLESVREKIIPSSPENKPAGIVCLLCLLLNYLCRVKYFYLFVRALVCVPFYCIKKLLATIYKKLMLELAILPADCSALFATLIHKRSTVFSVSFFNLYLSMLIDGLLFILDLLESASSAKESVEQTVSESLHSKLFHSTSKCSPAINCLVRSFRNSSQRPRVRHGDAFRRKTR